MNKADKIRIARMLLRLKIPIDDIVIALDSNIGQVKYWLSRYTSADLDEEYPDDDSQCRAYHYHHASNMPSSMQAIDKDIRLDNSCNRLSRIGHIKSRIKNVEEDDE